MTRTKYEFGSTLYRNRNEMTKAITEEYITAQGSNGTEAVFEILSEMSDSLLAADCIEGFGLNMRDDEGNPSHMEFNEYTDEELADEFREMRAADSYWGEPLSVVKAAAATGSLPAFRDGLGAEYSDREIAELEKY